MNFVSNHKLLVLVLAITLLKGVVWAYVVPPFQAPDEQTHYATIQHFAEPRGYRPQSYDFPIDRTYSFGLEYQNLSPELKNLLAATNFAQTRFTPDNKMPFQENSADGAQENQIRDSRPGRFVENYPAWVTGYPPLYYFLGSFLENGFSPFSVIERAYLIRLMSVFFGLLFVATAYFVFREINFTRPESALLAGAVSMQPMLTFITSSINVDSLLFLAFGLFVWGAVKLLRSGISWLGLGLIVLGLAIGFLTKPAAYFLLPAAVFLAVLYFFQERKSIFAWRKRFQALFIGAGAVFAFASAYLIYRQSLLTLQTAKPLSLAFVAKFLAYQSQLKIVFDRSLMYWGDFGWLNIQISQYLIYAIWLVMILGFLGMAVYFWRIIRHFQDADPAEKKRFFSIIYLVSLVVGLNLMIYCINFVQVNPDDFSDPYSAIGFQGRYFLPLAAAKFALIALGLAALFPKMRRKIILLVLFLGMALLNFIGLFGYIIPRFYL